MFNHHHGLDTCDADAASVVVPATAYGLQNTGVATMMAFLSHDMPRLLGAAGMGTVFSGFQSAPDLASKFASVMHASSFSSALAAMAAGSPALAADFTSPAKLATVLAAVAGDPQPAAMGGGGSAASTHLPNGPDATALAGLLHHLC